MKSSSGSPYNSIEEDGKRTTNGQKLLGTPYVQGIQWSAVANSERGPSINDYHKRTHHAPLLITSKRVRFQGVEQVHTRIIWIQTVTRWNASASSRLQRYRLCNNIRKVNRSTAVTCNTRFDILIRVIGLTYFQHTCREYNVKIQFDGKFTHKFSVTQNKVYNITLQVFTLLTLFTLFTEYLSLEVFHTVMS